MAEYKYYFDEKDAAVRKASISSVKAMKGGKAQVRWNENVAGKWSNAKTIKAKK